MSRALSVYHGRFGRATLYELNRAMTTHAHREGHLIFYLGGARAVVHICGKPHGVTERCGVAVNPWEPHSHVPDDRASFGRFLVLYIDPRWFQGMGREGGAPLQFGRGEIVMTPPIRSIVSEVVTLLENYDISGNFDGALFELTNACFAQAHQLSGRSRRTLGPGSSVVDFRVRKSIHLMSQAVGAEVELDSVARDAGLSRPHFYKLFRRQTGLTPNLYLNTLRMETAIAWLGETGRSVTDIGYDLGFSCQSVFTRFFSSHVGMAPTDYRRAVQVLRN